MKRTIIAGLGLLLASAGSAYAGGETSDEHYGYLPTKPRDCVEPAHNPADDCLCDREVVFYRPGTGWGNITVRSPGVRVYGRPVYVASGRIDIQGPPVYVDAPPVRIAAPQIYLHRPQVYVRPSDVTVEPPQIHYTGCEDGSDCKPAGPAH